ncbi:MAG: hypothetical protein EBU08_19400, partial [Micrococcales bacterium]|nr:hypothetical protein [Micrococcales bacterium]
GGAAGTPGVGVGGGELPPAGGVGGAGTKPSALTPEEAWNRHKNDDHPAFDELGPEEQAAWSDLVARGRDTAPNFQDIVEEHAKRSKRTPEQVKKALIDEYKPVMAQDIEKELAGKTFDQVLIFLANNGPEANREIAKKMQQRVKELRQVGYSFKFKLAATRKDVQEAGGYNDGTLGRVLAPGRSKVMNISVAGRNSGQPFGATYQVMTHEALHGVTAALVIFGESNPKTEAGRIAKELKSISKYVQEYLTNKERTIGLTSAENYVLNISNALGNHVPGGGRYNQAHEMISHGMTTPELMEVLETIPYSKTKSVGSYFVELFRKLLGLAPKYESALSEVIRLTQEIIEAPAADLQTATLKGARLRTAEATNFEEPVTFTSSITTPLPAPPAGPNVVPAPGQPYTLPKLTKLQPAPTVKQSVVDTTKKITDAYNSNDFWTKFRIAAVDPTSGLAKTLSSLPVFQDGKLRADMLVRAFSQVIN